MRFVRSSEFRPSLHPKGIYGAPKPILWLLAIIFIPLAWIFPYRSHESAEQWEERYYD